MNNISESFNATILGAKDKPTLTMCEWIRTYLMNRISTTTTKLERWEHRIIPIPRKRMDKEVYMSGKWTSSWSMGDKWEVKYAYNTQQFVVDVGKRTCSCGFWDLVGILCRHACAALAYRQQKPEEYVDDYYSRQKYALVYSVPISPINGMDMWPIVEAGELNPPLYKKGPGRLKKLRFRELGDGGTRIRRVGVTYRCTKCDQMRHNSRGYFSESRGT
ncbi:uncharacterized protein LOC131627090 [Vicia villosa]|uniref:uncharacterized protein LOC131627090 n=1 Tax=Vicia villosa TaxID=3911 RepID=UPI00273A84A4|nr:uncharacterized protein LOC131627090 [Vicia villosa]